jgi:iron complex outermembrane receptor protein
MSRKLQNSAFCVATMVAMNFASTVQAQSGSIDEIIVTARRVEESVQDVPISMSVFTPAQIADRNIVIASDLATYTPSLSVNARYGVEKSTFTLRGFNQDQSTAPTVGVYFADVVGVRAQGGTTGGNTIGAGSFTDLQNVQVLKGPQGTLFGRNTTGGAILLVPQKPTSDFGGYVEAQGGDYDLRRVQAALNVPLADSFRMRFAVDSNQRDGYMHNKSGIGPKDYNDVDYLYLRMSAVWDITDNLENYTIAHYSNSTTNGYATHIQSCDPTAVGSPIFGGGVQSGVRALTSYAACAQIARQAARGDGPYDVEVNNPSPHFDIKTWQVINTTTWHASDALTVKNIASYGEWKEQDRFNLYSDNFTIPAGLPTPLIPGVPLPALPVGRPFQYIVLDDSADGDAAAEYTATEELQLQGSTDDSRFKWVAGGYLEFSRPKGFSANDTGIYYNCATPLSSFNCTNPAFIGTTSLSRTKSSFDNNGVYAQGTYKVTDKWSLTLGGRWTFDKIDATGESTRASVVGPGAIVQTCNDTLRFRGTTPANTNPSNGGLIVSDFSQCALELQQKTNKPTWLIDVDYKPTDTLLLYAKYARGYRQGGISFTNIGNETWEPESVDSYEIGLKDAWTTDKVRGYFNIAGFYNDLTNQQIFASTLAKPAVGAQAGSQTIVNGGKSTIQGFEVESSVTFFDALKFDLGYAYLDTKLKSLVLPVLPAGSPFAGIISSAQVGSPLTLSPRNRLSLVATYTLPVPDDIGRMSVGATYIYTAREITNGSVPANLGVVPSNHLVNINLNWDKMFNGPVDTGLFITNATNEVVALNTGGGFTSGGVGDLMYAPPRMWGVRVKYSFGR